jgi:hypothetical protein
MNREYYVKLIINLSYMCCLCSCMLSVASRGSGQVDTCNSKREYLCSIVGSCLHLIWIVTESSKVVDVLLLLGIKH